MKKRKFVCSKCGRIYLKNMKQSPAQRDCFCHDCKDYTLEEIKNENEKN